MAMDTDITDALGKLLQIASACQRFRLPDAKGTRISHREMISMMRGGITAPVARTTPNSTIDVPKNKNDHSTMPLMCDAMWSAGALGGRNNPSACLSSR